MDKIKGNGEIILYQSEENKPKIQVILENETVWLTQAGIVDLFQSSKSNISEHIKHIFEEGELHEEATVRKFRTVRIEGSRNVERELDHYNLEVILAVGYRVKSLRGTQFRIWATERLKEYLVKGFTMDDERLKDVKNIGNDYFDEMLERIRDIRSSEKRFYQKIRDIYKLAVDYDPKSEETLEFFRIVQNKLHFAISGKTAAELISDRADASKDNMGLTSWTGTKVRKSDVTIAKNYLNSEELNELNRIVTMYLDYAEDQARRRKQIFMKDWREKLDAFLQFNDRNILGNSGKISSEIAEKLALEQYEIFYKKRLSAEAEEEARIDDCELRKLQKSIETGRKKK